MEDKRILTLENGFNFRELGGYRTKDGRQIKWHKLLRTSSLGDLSTNDLEYLSDYGVRYDIDFRSPKEVLDVPDRLPGTSKYQFNPIFNVDETKNSKGTAKSAAALAKRPESGYQQMLKVYQMIVTEQHAKNEYRHFFDALLANDAPKDTLLFHCTAGKDRTGMGAVYLLTALGVDWPTIQADYLLSNSASAEHNEVRRQSMIKNGASQAEIDTFVALWSVDERYLASAINMIKKQSGNIQHYLRTEIKLTKHEVLDLQAIYLAD